jgi:outer membrane autotransporter protein
VAILADTQYNEGDETVRLEVRDGNGTVMDTATLVISDSSSSSVSEETLTQAAQTPTQREIGQVVGKICDKQHASPRLLQRCNELVVNAKPRPGEVSNALQEIAPEEIAAHANIAAQSTAVQFRNVDARLGTLRKGSRKVLNLSGLNLNLKLDGQVLPSYLFASLLASNAAETESDSGAKASGGGDPPDPGFSRLGVFVNGNFNVGEKDRTAHESGFEFSTYGLTAGADYRFTDRLVAGIALGYSNNSTDLDAAGGNLDTNGYSVTFYGTAYQSDDIYVEGLYSFGRNNFSTQRNIFYGVAATRINQAALSSNGSDQHALGLGAGYHLNRNAFTITPNVRVDYVRTATDGFRETFTNWNAPGTELGLEIDGQTVTSTTLTVGTQTNYVLSQSWGVLIPHANLEMVHEFKNDSRSLTGRFLEDWDKNTFVLNTDEPDRDYFNLALGFSAQFTQGRSAFFQYQGTLGLKDYSSHGVMTGVRIEF